MKFNFTATLFTKETLYYTARGTGIAAAAIVLIVTILLIANYFQTKIMAPLNSKPLQTLMAQLKENPEDQALREQIRALDLLARKAYFTNQWQLRTGAFILLGSTTLLLISLKTMANLRKKLPMLQGSSVGSDTWLAAIQARKWLAISGMVLISTALGVSLLSRSDINREPVFAITMNLPTERELTQYWTNFRGPGGNGVASTEKAPTSWDGVTGQGIKWKTAVPKPGNSSPIVWKNRIFLTGGDKDVRELYCFDAESGKMTWHRAVTDIPGSPAQPPRVSRDTGYAAPTAATNGQYVCAIFATGDLVCYDLDGNRIWGKNLGLPNNHYGHSSSLIVYQNILIVQYDQRSEAMLLGLELATGTTIWRANRSVISWSSPICVNTGNRMELILTNSKSVDAYDPETGTSFWSEECLSGEVGPSAAYADGMVFVANDLAIGAGVRIGALAAEVAWEYDEYLPDTASPLATDKFVFFATSYGPVACLDAKTGKTLWVHEFKTGFFASPILVNDRVYALDLKGVMQIFQAEATFQSLGSPALGEPSVCTPAFVDDMIFIRGDQHLFCLTGQ